VAGVLPAHVIALDGKPVRHSHDRAHGTHAIRMVSAWATTNRLVLAQIKVDENTQGVPDEITALPKILGRLTLAGCIATIDAMGCQRPIAQQILDQGGDYHPQAGTGGLKGNQGTLHEDVQLSCAVGEADGWPGSIMTRARPSRRDTGGSRPGATGCSTSPSTKIRATSVLAMRLRTSPSCGILPSISSDSRRPSAQVSRGDV